MRKSKADTAETRKRIIGVAQQTFKSRGIHATGVAEIMAAAGLTHGAFYRHFSSKEQLVAEACAASMETLVESAELAATGGDVTYLKHLENFLSNQYRDNRLSGCPLVAIGSELVRADVDTRRAASQGYQDLIDIMATRSTFKDSDAAKEDAIFILSSMIGAVTMARIVDDPDLSDLILEATKKRLTTPATPVPKKREKSKVA
jgi:TetR/AcrR family transcriptional repressor of nem operon